ncbi:MAG TPA: glycoside hydrolase family 44 protein [Terracidiphilus sp.]|jgi:hypothetical protein|nr:glycoside hydrolase family 44 protein [Terracidiphilus sp.]
MRRLGQLLAIMGGTGLGVVLAACGGGGSTSHPTPSLVTPTVTVTASSPSITTAQPLSVAVAVSGGAGSPVPSGSVVLSGGGYTSAAASLANGSASITVPAGALTAGSVTLSAKYTPDSAGSSTYNGASGSASVTVTAPLLLTPSVTVSPSSSSVPAAQAFTVIVTVSGGSGNPMPSGSVTLSSGSYIAPATLVSGSATITVAAGSLPAGSNTLTAAYTPDANSSAVYAGASGSASVTVTGVSTTSLLTVNSTAPSSGVSINVTPADNNGAGSGSTPFTRTYNAGAAVVLTAPLSSGSYSFVFWSGCASNPSPSVCNVNLGANTTVTANYNQAGISSITVSPNTATIGSQQQFTATVNGNGSFSKSVAWSITCSACGATYSSGTLSASGLYTTPYPAPSSVVITATSTQNTQKSGSVTVTLAAPATATGPALNVDVNTPNTPAENPHTISPLIYGMNGYTLDTASAKVANPGLIRWGGDATSRYNYKNNWANSASDWYFENFQNEGAMYPNANSGSDFTQFYQGVDRAGSVALGTVPVLGWVANGTNGCSFPSSSYPNQIGQNGAAAFNSYNGEQCGYGAYAEGAGACTSSTGCSIYGSNTIAQLTSISQPEPDITASSTPAPGSVTASWANGTWAGGWVNSVVTASGNGASGNGVAMWDLDNEPTWWDAVHRDVHPNPFTYDEVTNYGIGAALAIKTADPTALVSGPVMDYWWAYFYSKKDVESGWSTGPCYQPWQNPADRTAHGGVPLIEYYLKQFAGYSQKYNVRLLDYLDIHGYFAPDYNGNSVAFTGAGDTQQQIARMNGTRVFWDPTYTDPNYPQPNYATDSNYTANCTVPAQAPKLIPMLQKWVADDYPGTKTAIDEYNFGGLESINGAVVQADILGIFGRQGLDMGAFWPSNGFSSEQPGNYAFAMYRNYDGSNSTFGDTYLDAASAASGADAEGRLAVYAAQRTSDHAITIMVVNKTYGTLTSTLALSNYTGAATSAQAWQYSNANLSQIVSLPAVTVTPGTGSTSTLTATYPGQSITLFVVPD